MTYLGRWLGLEGEEWTFVDRDGLTIGRRRIERVTVELQDGERERYHFDVTDARR